jgi:glutamate/tyrosine decarboxylase-like PLP-dependent enzyme
MTTREDERGVAPGGDGRASTLDIPEAERNELARAFYELALQCAASPEDLPVFPETSAGRLAEIFRRPLPVEPDEPARLLEDCREVVRHSRQNNHPRMFGYVASPAAPAAVFAGWLSSALNANVTSWRSAPGPTEVEKTVVGWLAELIGYAGEGRACGGLLTSGGSMANLNALFVAHRATAHERDPVGASHDPSSEGLWNAGAPATLYASDQAHLSIPKAADLLGLGRRQVRVVPTGEDFRMDVRALGEMVEADARAGLRPFCVVASAGTVSTGAVDPLAEVAAVARRHSLWFHVDGAYGALARADATRRHLFEGLEEADSVSLDPHKWLYTPIEAGCLLYREPARARAAFSGTGGDYIRIFERQEEEAHAFWDYGVELSRPFRALKVWALLRYYGARRVAECIAEDNALAAHLAELVRGREEFELMAPVTLGICCFRCVPAGERRALEEAADEATREAVNARLDELNARVMQRVQRGGAAYVSNAVLRGRFTLRASITNFRTTRRDLELTLDAVARAAAEG